MRKPAAPTLLEGDETNARVSVRLLVVGLHFSRFDHFISVYLNKLWNKQEVQRRILPPGLSGTDLGWVLLKYLLILSLCLSFFFFPDLWKSVFVLHQSQNKQACKRFFCMCHLNQTNLQVNNQNEQRAVFRWLFHLIRSMVWPLFFLLVCLWDGRHWADGGFFLLIK